MRYQSYILPAFCIIVLIFIATLRTQVVECALVGTQDSCPAELQESLHILREHSFFFTNIEAVFKATTPNNSIYTIQKIVKKFPATVSVTFSQEQPKYILRIPEAQSENYSETYVGESGIVLNYSSFEEKIVKITWLQEQSELPHQHFIVIANTLAEHAILGAEVEWKSDSEIILKIPDQPVFLFDTQTLHTQIQKVATIMKAKELEEITEPILEIDMRFTLPVLRTAQ